MWVLSGLIVLALSLAAGVALRQESRWRGIPLSLQGPSGPLRFEYEARTRKDKTTGWRLGVPAPDRFNFRLRRESGFDRFCKRLGVNHEQSTGDSHFDAAYYLDSDDTRVGQVLRDAGEARTRLHQVIRGLAVPGHQVHAVKSFHGRLWMESSSSEPLPDSWRILVAEALHGLAAALEAAPQGRGGDAFIWRALVLVGLSSGLGIGAIFALINRFGGVTDLLHPGRFLAGTLPFLLALALILLLLAARWIGNSARAHRVFAELTLIGMPSAVICLYTMLTLANMSLDRSPRRWHTVEEARVIDHTYRCGRRRHRTCHDYYVISSHWPGEFDGRGRIEINHAIYRALRGARRIDVAVQPGWLGAAWIAGLRPAAASP